MSIGVLLLKISLGTLQCWSLLFTLSFRSPGWPALVLRRPFLAIVMCWASRRGHLGCYLRVCVAILSNKMYSNYYLTAAMVWVFASLPYVVLEKFTGTGTSRPGTSRMSTQGWYVVWRQVLSWVGIILLLMCNQLLLIVWQEVSNLTGVTRKLVV